MTVGAEIDVAQSAARMLELDVAVHEEPPCRLQPKRMALNFLICSVSAVSTGRRSMEEAP